MRLVRPYQRGVARYVGIVQDITEFWQALSLRSDKATPTQRVLPPRPEGAIACRIARQCQVCRATQRTTPRAAHRRRGWRQPAGERYDFTIASATTRRLTRRSRSGTDSARRPQLWRRTRRNATCGSGRSSHACGGGGAGSASAASDWPGQRVRLLRGRQYPGSSF